MRSPAVELVRCCSARDSINQGMAISMRAKRAIQRQRGRRGRNCLRYAASGRRSKAAGSVRANTSVGGDSSRIDTLINR